MRAGTARCAAHALLQGAAYAGTCGAGLQGSRAAPLQKGAPRRAGAPPRPAAGARACKGHELRAAGRARHKRARLAAQQSGNVQQRERGRRGLPRLGGGAQLAQLPPVHVAPEAHLPPAVPLKPRCWERVGVGAQLRAFASACSRLWPRQTIRMVHQLAWIGASAFWGAQRRRHVSAAKRARRVRQHFIRQLRGRPRCCGLHCMHALTPSRKPW